MYSVSLATLPSELEQIADLSKANLRYHMTEEEKEIQGFLTWNYSLDVLMKMHEVKPTVIVKYGNDVVGYAITATKEMGSIQPELNNMVSYIQSLSYNGQPMTELKYYMMGQICIAKEHRGKGLFDKLYQHHKEVFGSEYDMLVTEISTTNHRSLQAHKNTGFETINTYRDTLDEWDVVVWKF